MTEEDIEKGRKGRNFVPVAIVLTVAMAVLLVVQFNRARQWKAQYESTFNERERCDSLLKERNLELAAWKKTITEEKGLIPKDANLHVPNYNEGIYFEVQIGSFTDFNLDEYLNEMAEIRQEKVDSTSKLLLGRFRSIRQARLFENDMKRIGLSDAFVIGRVNGKLVDVDEAIELQRMENNQ